MGKIQRKEGKTIKSKRKVKNKNFKDGKDRRNCKKKKR